MTEQHHPRNPHQSHDPHFERGAHDPLQHRSPDGGGIPAWEGQTAEPGARRQHPQQPNRAEQHLDSRWQYPSDEHLRDPNGPEDPRIPSDPRGPSHQGGPGDRLDPSDPRGPGDLHDDRGPGGTADVPMYDGPRPVQPPTGAMGWWLGLLSLWGVAVLGNIFGIIATAIVHAKSRHKPLLARQNARNALNWSISFGAYTVLLFTIHFIVLYLVTADEAYTGGFFPIGTAIAIWLAVGVYHVIGSIVCAVRASNGQVAWLPGTLPWVGSPR